MLDLKGIVLPPKGNLKCIMIINKNGGYFIKFEFIEDTFSEKN